MVNVRVADQQRIHVDGCKSELGVVINRLVAPALKHAAFEQEALAVDFEEVFGTGRGAVGSVEE